MNTARLKNIIIIVLLLANAFLLVLLFSRRAEENAAHERAVAQLMQLYSSDGVLLDATLLDGLPTTLLSVQPVRDTDAERAFAEGLIGSVSSVDSGGGIYRYYCADGLSRGSCLFRASGSIEAALTRTVDDPEQFCADLCAPFDYRVEETLTDGSRTLITAARAVGGFPVYNCALSFTFSGTTLTAVSGSFLPPLDTDGSETQSLDAVTSLVSFLDYRSASGAVCTDITALSGGYLLQSSATEPMRLVPVVRVETDVSNYYVNSALPEITREQT